MLTQILRGSSEVPVSMLKEVFRDRFGYELSETVFGHTKLVSLLNDPHLAQVCTVVVRRGCAEKFLTTSNELDPLLALVSKRKNAS